MLRQSFLTILLCGCLGVGAQAEPIALGQIERNLAAPPRSFIASREPAAAFAQGQLDQQPRAEEGTAHPEFVRLPDGRIVPYGQGVICAENCVESFTETAHRPRWWYFVPPVIAGGVICAVLCGGDRSRDFPRSNPTPFGTPTVPPLSTPPTSPVPEPATLMLLGAGLAVLARKQFTRRPSEKDCDLCK
jgi:hypothetical protein